MTPYRSKQKSCKLQMTRVSPLADAPAPAPPAVQSWCAVVTNHPPDASYGACMKTIVHAMCFWPGCSIEEASVHPAPTAF